MQNVSRFESGLLRLLYYFLRREPIERALPVLENRSELPACLSPGAVRLVKDAIAKGTTFWLSQRGGWRDERHLRSGKPVSGRLWERTAPEKLGLTFSKQSLHFLMWVTGSQPKEKSNAWSADHDELTLGDLVLLFFAHEGLRETPDNLGAPVFRKRAPMVHHGLARLAYPEDFTQPPDDGEPRFGPWMSDEGACIIEALQPELTARWVHIESGKERIEAPQVMRDLGTSQERALVAFLDACEKANRRDLARFLLRAGHQLVNQYAHPGMWTAALQMSGQRIMDRAATYQAATAMLRQYERLTAWARWARAVWKFDEEFPAAQLWLSDWESYDGDNVAARAQGIIRALDPMRQAVAGGGAAT